MSRLTSVSIEAPGSCARRPASPPRAVSAAMRTCVVLGLAAPLLVGCGMFGGGSKKCHERQGYEAARSVPPLKSADGSPVQATRNALKIPEVSQTAKERAAGDPCLDEPPSFYPGRPKPGQGPATADTPAAKPGAESQATRDAVPAPKP